MALQAQQAAFPHCFQYCREIYNGTDKAPCTYMQVKLGLRSAKELQAGGTAQSTEPTAANGAYSGAADSRATLVFTYSRHLTKRLFLQVAPKTEPAAEPKAEGAAQAHRAHGGRQGTPSRGRQHGL